MSIGDIAALLKALKRDEQRNRFSGRTGRGIYCRSYGRIFVISRLSFFVLYTVRRQEVQNIQNESKCQSSSHARARVNIKSEEHAVPKRTTYREDSARGRPPFGLSHLSLLPSSELSVSTESLSRLKGFVIQRSKKNLFAPTSR